MMKASITPVDHGDRVGMGEAVPSTNDLAHPGSLAGAQFRRLVKGDQAPSAPALAEPLDAALPGEGGADQARGSSGVQKSARSVSRGHAAPIVARPVQAFATDLNLFGKRGVSSLPIEPPTLRMKTREDRSDLSPTELGAGCTVDLPPASSPTALAKMSKPVVDAHTPVITSGAGELAQLLAAHCKGVYVGGEANSGRVMLRLSGSLNGVSVEIVNTGGALGIRMHGLNRETWARSGVHLQELERDLP